jgi:curved DNA-binding protein CbpA
MKTDAGPKPAADYCELMQLSPKADPATVHRVFRILAQRYHPDNVDTGNAEMYRILMAASNVLSDPEQRAAYDVRRAGARELRWKICDTVQAAQGAEAEKRKRQRILSLLYTERLREPDRPTFNLREMEDLLGCPREHLEFSLWYLKESGLIGRADNARFTITIQGVDAAEAAVRNPCPQTTCWRRQKRDSGLGTPSTCTRWIRMPAVPERRTAPDTS